MLDTIVKNSDGIVVGGVFCRLSTKQDVEFLNLQGNNLEVGFMNRDKSNNVKAHYHNNISRNIEGTHEILVFLSGKAKVVFYEIDGKLIDSIKVSSPCLVFFNGGGHEVKFSEKCEIIEIKQGPYLKSRDKIILNLVKNNDSSI